MENSFVNTVTLALSGTVNPTVIVRARDVPMRVVIRNLNAVNIARIAMNTTDLTPTGQSAVFDIPASSEEVFMIAPKQTIYGVCLVAGVTVSFAASEALPI